MRLLITSDLHLRSTVPTCRQESPLEWVAFQEKQLEEIMDIAQKTNCDSIIIAGDIFHTSKVPPIIEYMFLNTMSKYEICVYIMPGQHDLPGHSFDRIEQSSFGVIWHQALKNMGTSRDSYGLRPMTDFCDWESFQTREIIPVMNKKDILCVHRLITPITSKLLLKNSITAADLLDTFPEYQLIIAGDYHNGFDYIAPKRSSQAGRVVVVPGCINRQAADFETYEPSVAIVEIDDTHIEVNRIVLTDPLEFFYAGYLQGKKEKEDRISAFIEATKSSGSLTFSFEDNVRAAMDSNDYPDVFIETVNKYMGWNE